MYTGLTPHHLQPTAVLYTGFTVLAKSKSASLSTVSLAKQYIFSKCKKIHCVSSVLTMSAGHKQRHLVHNSPACRLLQLSKELPFRPAMTALQCQPGISKGIWSTAVLLVGCFSNLKSFL